MSPIVREGGKERTGGVTRTAKAKRKRAPNSARVYGLFMAGHSFALIAQWLGCSELAAEDAFRRAHKRRARGRR